MEKSWTVIKFCEENSVEAVPTTWLVGSDHCYWPPFPQDKVLQAIRRHDPPNTCWPLHKAEVFRCGTYENYLQARNKSRKAEYESDLNSDCDKFNRAGRHRRAISTDEETELSELAVSSYRTRKKCPSPPRIPSVNNPPKDNPSTEDAAVSTITQINLQTVDIQTCSCCKQHKNDEIIKSIHEQQILMRNILSQVLEELQQLRVLKCSATEKDNETTSIFSLFHFPINNDEQLNDVEEYLKDENNFKAAINELSKLGGSSVYDLVKRCLNTLLTNTYAAEYSWLGMKKKKVFSNLKLSKVLIGACDRSLLAENMKASEEAIKKWLRRAKERGGTWTEDEIVDN